MNQPTHLSGTIDRVIFKNEESGFCVCAVRISQAETITVRGPFAHLRAGEQITLTGAWVDHPKFGRQFEAQSCTVHLPTSAAGLQKYLASGVIKGVGPACAELLIKKFGITVLEVIEKEPEKLTSVHGIGLKRMQMITDSWQTQRAISHIMVFLQEKGISPTYAMKIYKKYGHDAINVVIENPYRLADEVWGIGFAIADQIAQNLGMPADSLNRIKAAILFVINTAVNSGHLYIPLETARTKTAELIELPEEKKLLIKNALHELHTRNAIVLITHENIHYITRTHYYYTERTVATQVKQLLSYPALRTFDLHAIYTKLRTGHYGSLALHEDQQKGIMSALEHKFSIITGGPGTGKTTLIKTLLAILDEAQVRYRLAAPTGKAAKRMGEATDKQAVTLHRLLEYDPAVSAFSRNENNALALDMLIIDESSMIDIFLMHAILKAMPHHAYLILIGDIDQLPSVGAGNVLGDLIASKIIPCVKLTHIFRQAQESLIITNAHRINHGEPLITEAAHKNPDLLFFKEQEPEAVINHLKRIYGALLPRYGIKAHNAITLSPMKRNLLGTQNLNCALQQIVNPYSEQKLVSGSFTYHVDDRVMQIKNNYETGVFNGDTGIITAINPADHTMTVQFTETSVTFTAQELDEVVPAYAISIHKSQGSEFDAVIIVLFMQHFMLLNRNLLYTALTRAKKLCIIVGQPKAVAIAIKNNLREPRCTFLTAQLTTGITCRIGGSQ
jgi:exodeoxyribonuclease V alpha subunit